MRQGMEPMKHSRSPNKGLMCVKGKKGQKWHDLARQSRREAKRREREW